MCLGWLLQAVYFCGIVASSQDLAFVYAIAWTALNLLVNPYMASFDEYTLGWGFSWLRFVSPCSFAWQALINIEFSGRGFDCNNGAGTEAVGLYPSEYQCCAWLQECMLLTYWLACLNGKVAAAASALWYKLALEREG